MKALSVTMAALLISGTVFAANVFPTRSADQSRPSKSATLIGARLPTKVAFIAHCEPDYDSNGNPILAENGNQTYTCWYEMDPPVGDAGPCMGGFVCVDSGTCSTDRTTPYSGCAYPSNSDFGTDCAPCS